MQRQQRGDTFEGSGSTERMSVHRLGRTHGEALGMLPEDRADGLRLHQVVGQRAGAVRVDVADLFGLEAAVAQRCTHGLGCSFPRRLDDVVRVRRHPQADDLSVDRRASGTRPLQRLEHEHRAAFPEDHPAAVFAEGTTGVGCHHAQGRPGFQITQAEGRLAPACDGDVDQAMAHHPEGSGLLSHWPMVRVHPGAPLKSYSIKQFVATSSLRRFSTQIISIIVSQVDGQIIFINN